MRTGMLSSNDFLEALDNSAQPGNRSMALIYFITFRETAIKRGSTGLMWESTAKQRWVPATATTSKFSW